MKRVLVYIFQIVFSILIIISSFFVMDSLDVSAYEEVINTYNNIGLQLNVNEDFNELDYMNNQDIKYGTLYISNYEERVYDKKLYIEFSLKDKNFYDSLYIYFNGSLYNLNDENCLFRDNKYICYLDSVYVNEYEKLKYDIKLFLDDDFIGIIEGFDYNLVLK